MEVEITSITENNIEIKLTGFGEFDGVHGVKYHPKELDSIAVYDGKEYRFTHLLPLFLDEYALHFLVKKWEDGVITVFCHVTDDGDKVTEATGRSS